MIVFPERGHSCEVACYSWSSDPVPGRTPPEAVMLVIEDSTGERRGLRMKSRAAVDEVIDMLERTALDVWGKR